MFQYSLGDTIEKAIKNQKAEAFHIMLHELNVAFKKDSAALFSLVTNKVPCNLDVADDLFIVVDKLNLEKDHFAVGPIGLVNGILKLLGYPLLAIKFGEPDSDGRKKVIGFCEYVANT